MIRGLLFLLAVVGVMSVGAGEKRPIRVVLTFDDGLKEHLTIVAPELEKRGWRGVFNIITDKIGTSEKKLNWDDVKELIRRGHEVTTHTKNHPDLVKLLQEGKEDEVRRQIAESRDAIIRHTGFAPRYLCTPYVSQNEVTDRICREEGLQQMNVPRGCFGSKNVDGAEEHVQYRRDHKQFSTDMLHHGVTAEGGAYDPFPTRASFVAHLDNIKRMEERGEIIVTDYDGAASNCELRAKEWPHHGIVALSFDDGYINDWTLLLPLFTKYGARATFFFTFAITEQRIEFGKKALLAGCDFGLHGLKHRNADEAIAKMGAEKYIQEEIEPQWSVCRAAGIPIFSFAYPNTVRNDTSDAVLFKSGFTRLRGKGNGMVSPNPYDPKGEKLAQWRKVAETDCVFDPAADFLRNGMIKGVILGSAYHTDIDDIMAAIRRAGDRAETLAILSHDVRENPSCIGAKKEWIERIVKEAAECGVVVRGVR